MGDTLGKVPNVAIVQLFSLIFAILVYRGDKHSSFVNKGPFGLSEMKGVSKSVNLSSFFFVFFSSLLTRFAATYNSVPMQLPDGASLKVLLRARNIMAGRQILNDLLSNPAALEETRLRI